MHASQFPLLQAVKLALAELQAEGVPAPTAADAAERAATLLPRGPRPWVLLRRLATHEIERTHQ
jgi:hypothetical protein